MVFLNLSALAGFNSCAGWISLLDFEDEDENEQWLQLKQKSLEYDSLNDLEFVLGPAWEPTDENSKAKLELYLN